MAGHLGCSGTYFKYVTKVILTESASASNSVIVAPLGSRDKGDREKARNAPDPMIVVHLLCLGIGRVWVEENGF